MERQGMLPSALGREYWRDVESEDDAVHSSLAEARQVHVAVFLRRAQIGGRLPEASWDVGVAVEDEAVVVKSHGENSLARLLVDAVVGIERGGLVKGRLIV